MAHTPPTAENGVKYFSARSQMVVAQRLALGFTYNFASSLSLQTEQLI